MFKYYKYILVVFILFIGINVNAAAIYGPTSCTATHYRIIKNDEFGTDTHGVTSTTYNISWSVIAFYGSENMEANTYYDVKITFINNIPSNFIRDVEFYQTSSLCGNQSGQFNASFGYTGKVLTFRVLTGPSLVDFWQVWLTLSGVTNSNGISTVTLSKVDMTGSSGIIENANENTNNIINNQNDNAQDIIDSQNQNAQDIIDNQNQNTQDIIDSQKVCKIIDKTSGVTDGFLYNNGQVGSDSNQVVTDYFPVSVNTTITKLNPPLSDAAAYRICFYNPSKVFISCLVRQDYTNLTDIPIPDNASFVRFTIQKTDNVPKFKYCTNGDELVQGSIDNLNDVINNSNIDNNLIDSVLDIDLYDNNDLASIITAPLTLINALLNTNSQSCQPLEMPVSLHTGLFQSSYSQDKTVYLPCGSIMWSHANSTLISLYRLVVCGFIYFYVCKALWKTTNDVLDPFKDNVEVIDL